MQLTFSVLTGQIEISNQVKMQAQVSRYGGVKASIPSSGGFQVHCLRQSQRRSRSRVSVNGFGDFRKRSTSLLSSSSLSSSLNDSRCMSNNSSRNSCGGLRGDLISMALGTELTRVPFFRSRPVKALPSGSSFFKKKNSFFE